MLPAPFDALDGLSLEADLILSMGVLSHRRAPFAHLQRLLAQLRPGGTLILENLVVEGDAERVLTPPGRYAKMRNVWQIPSAAALTRWCARVGFEEVELCDVTETAAGPDGEQRRTAWMRFDSLAEALDPEDPTRTIEGHPRPRRAVLRARRPAR